MIVRIVNPGAYLDIRHATRADRGATISARFRSTPRSTSWASGPTWYSLPSILARAAAFAPVSVCGRSGLTRPSSGASTQPRQTALTLAPRLAPAGRPQAPPGAPAPAPRSDPFSDRFRRGPVNVSGHARGPPARERTDERRADPRPASSHDRDPPGKAIG